MTPLERAQSNVLKAAAILKHNKDVQLALTWSIEEIEELMTDPPVFECNAVTLLTNLRKDLRDTRREMKPKFFPNVSQEAFKEAVGYIREAQLYLRRKASRDKSKRPKLQKV